MKTQGEKVNLLFVTHVTSMYGANSSMIDVLRYIDRKKFNVYVIGPGRGDIVRYVHSLNIKYKAIDMCSTVHMQGEKISFGKLCKNIQAIIKMCKIVKEWKIDIIHSNSSVINLGAIVSCITKKKHVWHIRELPVQYNYKNDFALLDRLLLNRSDKVICISEYVKEEIEKRKKIKNLVQIYDAIDVRKYIINHKDIFSDGNINILVCGLIIQNKRQLDAVRAVRMLIGKGYENIRLIIVGDGEEYRKEIVKYIKAHQLEKYIKLYPFTSDLRQFRRNADIAVMSSVNEALGRVTIESMLSELIVIGADSGATSELIREKYNGLKYNCELPEELALKIEYAIKNKKQMEEIIKNAKKFALKNFGVEKNVKKVEQIYISILKRKM